MAERRTTTITWHEGGHGASVTCETWNDGVRTAAYVWPSVTAMHTLVKAAQLAWREAFPVLFP